MDPSPFGIYGIFTSKAEAHVSDLIDHHCHWWKVGLIKEIFGNEEVDAILSIPLSTTYQPDILMWRGTANGEFTMGSAFHLAKEWENR
jgi:hypothetical protein